MPKTNETIQEETEDMLEYFKCDCHSPQHHFTLNQLSFVREGWDDQVYIEIHMNQSEPWYKRIWFAIKYVFGYKSRYGNWDSITLAKKDVIRLRDACDKALGRMQVKYIGHNDKS